MSADRAFFISNAADNLVSWRWPPRESSDHLESAATKVWPNGISTGSIGRQALGGRSPAWSFFCQVLARLATSKRKSRWLRVAFARQDRFRWPPKTQATTAFRQRQHGKMSDWNRPLGLPKQVGIEAWRWRLGRQHAAAQKLKFSNFGLREFLWVLIFFFFLFFSTKKTTQRLRF